MIDFSSFLTSFVPHLFKKKDTETEIKVAHTTQNLIHLRRALKELQKSGTWSWRHGYFLDKEKTEEILKLIDDLNDDRIEGFKIFVIKKNLSDTDVDNLFELVQHKLDYYREPRTNHY